MTQNGGRERAKTSVVLPLVSTHTNKLVTSGAGSMQGLFHKLKS